MRLSEAASGLAAVLGLAGTAFGLRQAAVAHSRSVSPFDIPGPAIAAELVVVPLAVVAAVLVGRSAAWRLGRFGLVVAAGFALARVADAYVAWSAPNDLVAVPPVGPFAGTAAMLGSGVFAAAATALAVGLLTAFPEGAFSRDGAVMVRVAAAGLLLLSLGLALRPEALTRGAFVSAARSPLRIDGFESGAAALRLAGVVTIVLAGLTAAVARLWDRRGGLWRLTAFGGVAALPALSRGTSYGWLRLACASAAALVAGVGADAASKHLAPTRPTSFWKWAGSGGSFDRPALTAVAATQVAAAVWAFALLFAVDDGFDNRGAAAATVVAAAACSAWSATLVARGAARSRHVLPATCAIAVGALIVFADGALAAPGHLFSGAVTLGGPWPFVAVAGAGVIGGWPLGLLGGAVVALARLAGIVVADDAVFESQALGLLGISAGAVARGGASGLAAGMLRSAEATIASARAREQVTRRLHDGVLQSLAVIMRRSDQPELAELAQASDRDLRAFLKDGSQHLPGDVEAVLRTAAEVTAARFGLRVEVVVDVEPRGLDSSVLAALSGAVGEALANVAKHAFVSEATVFCGEDVDGRLLVTVVDRGVGYVPKATSRMGIAGSIRGAWVEVGGRAQVRAMPGGGTEVSLWFP